MSDFPLGERCQRSLDRRKIARLRKRIEQLQAALQSIVGQTDDCDADETYYGGVWREINLTAKNALAPEDKT